MDDIEKHKNWLKVLALADEEAVPQINPLSLLYIKTHDDKINANPKFKTLHE